MDTSRPERDARGAVLLAIARGVIAERLGLGSHHGPSESWLTQTAATFVTLRIDGQLRGCIGTVDASRALAEDVAHNARAAAFGDPRFTPLTGDEFPGLRIEVSLLSVRSPVLATSEAEALATLRPGVDGVYLELGQLRATFLPQVWESIADPRVFLAELRRKADLPPSFWHPAIRLSRYTVEKFQEGPADA